MDICYINSLENVYIDCAESCWLYRKKYSGQVQVGICFPINVSRFTFVQCVQVCPNRRSIKSLSAHVESVSQRRYSYPWSGFISVSRVKNRYRLTEHLREDNKRIIKAVCKDVGVLYVIIGQIVRIQVLLIFS